MEGGGGGEKEQKKKYTTVTLFWNSSPFLRPGDKAVSPVRKTTTTKSECELASRITKIVSLDT